MRNIRKAVHAGYCWGVERALDIVNQTAETHKDAPVRTLGPIIHNPQVVQSFANKGVNVIDSLDEMPEGGGTVIVRTHGVAPEIYQKAEDKNLTVVDATCPLVTLVQNKAKQLVNEGYHLIIFGNPNHPEVIGTLGHAGGRATIIEKPADARTAKLPKKVGVVVQTTQETELVSELLAHLAPRCKEIKVFNTICNPTIERQDAARELAREVQVMIVVGGKNSSNTRHLVDVCREEGATTYHIEEPGEVEPTWFAGMQEVGVTAGASTPGWLMDRVIARIHELEQHNLLPASL
jgi:4-hydroxy-3-methylbut-2-enyl diphosphate reductase